MLVKTVQRLAMVGLLAFTLVGCSNKTPGEHLEAGRAHFAEGDFGAALIEAKNALQKSSKFADARILMGDVHVKQGDYLGALGEYDRALDLGAGGDELTASVALVKLRIGRVQEVVGQLQEIDPRTQAMDLILAEGYLAAGDQLAAKPLFEAHPDSAMGQAGLASLAWNAGEFESAGKHFARALEIDPVSTEVWLRQGELQLATGAHAEAMASFRKADSLPGGQVIGAVGVVRTLLAQGEIDNAGVEVDQVLERAPNYPLALYLRGLVLFQQDDIKGSESSLREVQSRYPDHGPTQYLMGLVKYKLGQFSQAEDNLKRYLARDDSNESVRKLLASVRFDQGDLSGVIELLAPSESVSQDPQVMAMLGSARLRTGDLSGATTALERAVELAPDMAPFRNQLALTLLSAGKQELAEATLQDAISVDEDQFQSEYLIAMLKLREGKFAEASQAVDAIVSKTPDNPIGFNLRGAIALAQDDKDSARANFEKALEKSPSFEPAANNLARLLESEGSLEGAKSVYMKLLEQSEDNESALIGLAEIAVRGGDIPGAIRFLERSVASNADSLESRLGLARLQASSGLAEPAQETIAEALALHKGHPDFLALQAQLDLQEGNQVRAEQSIGKLQVLLSNNPKNLALTGVLAELQLRVGNRTMARRNFEQMLELSEAPPANALLRLARFDLAENKFTSARRRLAQLRAVPDLSADIVTLLDADIAMAEGKKADAQKLYQSLATAGSRDGVLRLSTMMFRDNNSAAGTKLLEDWLVDNEGDQGTRALLAGAQLSAGNSQAAVVHYEKLQASGNPVVLNNLAWIYMEQGDTRAVEIARKAAEAAPTNADIADTYGWVLIQLGSAQEGVEVLKSSMQRGKENPTVLYHLGVGYQKLGNLDKAKETLVQALDLGEFAERDAAAELLQSLG